MARSNSRQIPVNTKEHKKTEGNLKEVSMWNTQATAVQNELWKHERKEEKRMKWSEEFTTTQYWVKVRHQNCVSINVTRDVIEIIEKM